MNAILDQTNQGIDTLAAPDQGPDTPTCGGDVRVANKERVADKERRARASAARAEDKCRQLEELDALLSYMARPVGRRSQLPEGVGALTFASTDPGTDKVFDVCRLNTLRMIVLRQQTKGGAPSAPLLISRFEHNPLTGGITSRVIAGFDLALAGDPGDGRRPLVVADNPILAATATSMCHSAREFSRDELPELPEAFPDFLFGFRELPEPAPVVFEENPVVMELAQEYQVDTDEVWTRYQRHVVITRGGGLIVIDGPRPDVVHPGDTLYSVWPSYFFARDVNTRYETHPVDGTPRPDDDWTATEGWFLQDGVPMPRAQKPDLVLASTERLKGQHGRLVRNPAWSSLRRKRVISWQGTMADFRDQLAGGWPEYLADFKKRRVGFWNGVQAETRRLASAFGLPDRRSDISALLAAPHEPCFVPDVPVVQLFRHGGPCSETMSYEVPGGRFDLYDGGDEGTAYDAD